MGSAPARLPRSSRSRESLEEWPRTAGLRKAKDRLAKDGAKDLVGSEYERLMVE